MEKGKRNESGGCLVCRVTGLRQVLSWQQSAAAAAARGSDSVAHVEKAAAGSADLLAVRTRADRVSVHVRCPAGEGG